MRASKRSATRFQLRVPRTSAIHTTRIDLATIWLHLDGGVIGE
jgi:hypothetical protein